jgi:hypothetical protein
MVADPIAVLVAVREGEPSLLDGADLPILRIGGLSLDEAARLAPELSPAAVRRLHQATAGNPLALRELAGDAGDLMLAPEGAPAMVSARISRAFLRRVSLLGPEARQALVLAAISDIGDLATLERAAARLEIDLSSLSPAEHAGLVSLGAGVVEFRHPLVRSAVYADAPADHRRAAHRAMAAVLPDRDADRRAWHLAAAAVGPDEAAAAALAQAAAKSRGRSAYATAAAAFERAGRLTAEDERRAWLAVAPLFLRQASAGRSLLEHALQTARSRAAVGVLPFALNLIARDQATTDRWAVAEATYQEAIGLARESGQQTELAFGLAGLAWLHARRGREADGRAGAAEALELCRGMGTRLHEIWATAALGELELGLGDAARAPWRCSSTSSICSMI